MDYDTGKIFAGHQTLKSFALPPGKTPLFIGGSGVTLEDTGGSIVVVVYPVAVHAIAALTLPEDVRPITVRVHGLLPDRDWSGVRVIDSHGHSIGTRPSGHGFSFSPRPGEAYSVEALSEKP
jgi:hypothetical protein